MRFLPLNQVLHVVRLEDVLDEVVKSVRADEPLGRSRVYEDAVDLVALDEVEGVKGLALDRVPGVVDEVQRLVVVGLIVVVGRFRDEVP